MSYRVQAAKAGSTDGWVVIDDADGAVVGGWTDLRAAADLAAATLNADDGDGLALAVASLAMDCATEVGELTSAGVSR